MATVPPFDNITIKLSGQPHRSNVCLYKNTIFFEKRKTVDSVEFELYFYFKLSVFHTCCGSGDSSIFQNYRLWLNKITDFGYFLYSFVGKHIPLSKKVGLTVILLPRYQTSDPYIELRIDPLSVTSLPRYQTSRSLRAVG